LSRIVVFLFVFISILSILTIHSSLATTRPAQYGQVDIWTNKGGQGSGQYGGAFTIGESITVFVYSSFDGYGVVAVCYSSGGCYEVDEGPLHTGQTVPLMNTVGAPAGQHQLILQVCPSGPSNPTTYTHSELNKLPEFVPNQSCPGDTTVIDVYGGPPDIFVSRCWVTPSNPLQEDQVTFYATVGNSGGTAANNVEIDAYVDGNLFSSERQNLSAGSSGTWYSNSRWTAQDGSHTLRVVANADHSVQESNYANNEASCTFFVSPHTIRVTITHTTTSTTIRSQWTTTTSTIQQYTTKIVTSETTVQSTLTASPILTSVTTTGLWYTTIYSPVVTTTVTVAQAISNPFYLIAPLILALALVVRQGGLEENLIEDFLRHFVRVLRSKTFRRTLVALLLIAVSLVSVGVIAVKPGYASTITLTSSRSQTLFTTLTTSLTSTRYTTSSVTDTSTLTNTKVQSATTTPTSSVTITLGPTSTVHLPTTTTSSTTSSPHQMSIGLRILDGSCNLEVTDILKGQTYCIELTVNNPTGTGASVTISGKLQFDGNPNQQIGDSWGGSWSLSAVPDFQQLQSVTVNLGQGQTSSRAHLSPHVYLTWNWIAPVGLGEVNVDFFWSLIWDILDTLLNSVGADIFGMLWGTIDLTKQVDSTIRAVLGGTLDETWNLDVTASTTGHSSSASKQIRARVSGPMEFALVSSIVTGLLATIGSIVGIIAGCVFTGGIACIEGAIAGAALGWVAWAAGSWEYKAATDPDDDYGTVPTPQIFIPPTIQSMSEGPAKSVAVSSMRYYAYVNAFSTAMTRYYSAESHDVEDVALSQVTAAQEYLTQAKSEFKQVMENYGDLKLPALDRLTFTQNLMTFKQNTPPQLQTLFSELGNPNFQSVLFSTADNVTALIPQNQSITLSHLLESASQSLDSEAEAVIDLEKNLPKPTPNLLTPLNEVWSRYKLIITFSVLMFTVVLIAGLLISRQRYRKKRLIK
jgi:hypothetical protein